MSLSSDSSLLTRTAAVPSRSTTRVPPIHRAWSRTWCRRWLRSPRCRRLSESDHLEAQRWCSTPTQVYCNGLLAIRWQI